MFIFSIISSWHSLLFMSSPELDFLYQPNSSIVLGSNRYSRRNPPEFLPNVVAEAFGWNPGGTAEARKDACGSSRKPSQWGDFWLQTKRNKKCRIINLIFT